MTRPLTRLFTALMIALGTLTVGALGTQPEKATASAAHVPAAISDGVQNAAKYGVTQYVVILDRASGRVIGSTGNLDTQVASESLVKVMIAAYYLRANGGTMPASMHAEMWDMIVRSNNDPASKYWSNSIVPTIASAYGLTGTYNNPPRPGYWGATHVTARDMAKLMWSVWNDPLVNGWLLTAMRNAATTDPTGSNQVFGFNSIDGDHGSKQGWGCDSYWLGPCSMGSIGWSDKVMGAVLQTGPQSAWGYMRGTSTYTTQAIVNAARIDPPHLDGRDDPEGDFGAWLGGPDGMTLYLDGWAFDGSDLSWAVPVRFTMDGVTVATTIAGGPSPELDPYGIPYNHGFFGSVTMPNTGSHEVCIYASNTLAGSDQLIKCLTATVPENPLRDDPRGALSATVLDNGDIRATGWMFDPSSASTSISGWLVDNGSLVKVITANQPSPALYSYGIGGDHGHSHTFAPTAYGEHSVCVYGLNVGWGKHTWIDCESVTLSHDAMRDDPRGDALVHSSDSGRIVMVGWAIDPNVLTAQVTLMWTLDGKAVAYGYANHPSDYLYAYGVPGQHGAFAAIGATPGPHQVCMFAINVGLGSDQLIACRNATVTA